MLRLGTASALRVVAFIAATALCFGPLLTSLHEAAVRHAACAVHAGETVHVQGVTAEAPVEAPTAAGQPAHHPDDAHERCAFDASRVAAAPGRAQRGAPSAPLLRGRPLSPAVPEYAAWPLYRLAPKSSPPA